MVKKDVANYHYSDSIFLFYPNKEGNNSRAVNVCGVWQCSGKL